MLAVCRYPSVTGVPLQLSRRLSVAIGRSKDLTASGHEQSAPVEHWLED